MKKLGMIIFIAFFISIVGAILFKGDLLINRISLEEANKIINENFGKCESNYCEKLDISIGVNKNKNMIIAEYIGLKDDSIKSKKERIILERNDGKWEVLNKLDTEYICQEGRGQQEYKSDLCR